MESAKDLIEVLRGEKPVMVAVEPKAFIGIGVSVFIAMLLAIVLAEFLTKKI